jgi:hypothetical protein
LTGGIVAMAFVGMTVLTQAHAKLEKSEPAASATLTTAPANLKFWFNEKLDLKVTKITLTGPAGKVELGAAHAMGDKVIMAPVTGKMAAGKYSVDWQTAGDDGHVLKGTFAFNLKAK